MKGVLIPADYAEEQGGKLYLMGGGWTRLLAGVPVTIALGILLTLEPEETEVAHKMTVRLAKAGSDAPVLDASNQPLIVQGTIESRPRPNVELGTNLVSPIAVRIPPMMLPKGHYVWELTVGTHVLDTYEFDAIEGEL